VGGGKMKKWKAVYSSLTAYYKCGTYYAETKEEAEKQARIKNAGSFSRREQGLIKCYEDED